MLEFASIPWLRQAGYACSRMRPKLVPQKLATAGMLVTAQENAGRYCYGMGRAFRLGMMQE